jgi:hypothetical protein
MGTPMPWSAGRWPGTSPPLSAARA